MVPDGGASNDGAQRAFSGPGCNGFGFLDAVLPTAVFTGGLVKPATYKALPILMEVPIRDHIISLTHFVSVIRKLTVCLETHIT